MAYPLDGAQVAAAWKISHSKASQSFKHWFAKLVRLAAAHPVETVAILSKAMKRAERDASSST